MPGAEHAGVPVATARQPVLEVEGVQLAAGLRTALAWLQANQDVINDLNVFPVPDGDTGSNMYLTLRSAVEDVQKATDPASAAAVMQAAARGSLMGARGNSGVILSQILRGFAQGLQGSPRADATAIAAALSEASAVAYKAVIKPTEGTVLTVVREAAASAQRAAARSTDVVEVLEEAVRAAHAAVERTPELLAVLRDAGVVDAGGFGFAVALEGLAQGVSDALAQPSPPQLAAARRVGEPRIKPPQAAHATPTGGEDEPRRGAAAVAAPEGGWGYCTEFLVHGPGLDVGILQRELGALGESSLVVGDEELVRVHIHAHDPAALITAASLRGRLSRLKVEDMSAQHHEILERAGGPVDAAAPPQEQRVPLGIVSVSPGEGFHEILRGIGANEVVVGGQTMNPSIEDLLQATRAVGSDAVILLPNNGNVILTAQQIDALADDVAVRVVPTRNLPQGISALLAYDQGASLDANCERMTEAMSAVRAIEITHAVRDTTVDGRDIHAGDVIAVVDDRITQVGDDTVAVACAALDDVAVDAELVTVYRGAGVSEGDGEALVAALRTRHPGVEFEQHLGGQEHYPFILSVE